MRRQNEILRRGGRSAVSFDLKKHLFWFFFHALVKKEHVFLPIFVA
jgi:hypothetical protein